MSPADVEVVRAAFGGIVVGSEIDMGALFADEEGLARLAELIRDDAVVEFATPDGGFVGDMAGPFRGAPGLRQGWAEWLAPWESLVVRPTDFIDVADGRVLLLADSAGRMAGSGLEVDTHVAAVYTIRDGTITEIRHYLDQDQAKREAGLA